MPKILEKTREDYKDFFDIDLSRSVPSDDLVISAVLKELCKHATQENILRITKASENPNGLKICFMLSKKKLSAKRGENFEILLCANRGKKMRFYQ